MFPLFKNQLAKSAENREGHWCWLTSSADPPLSLSLTGGNACVSFLAC